MDGRNVQNLLPRVTGFSITFKSNLRSPPPTPNSREKWKIRVRTLLIRSKRGVKVDEWELEVFTIATRREGIFDSDLRPKHIFPEDRSSNYEGDGGRARASPISCVVNDVRVFPMGVTMHY